MKKNKLFLLLFIITAALTVSQSAYSDEASLNLDLEITQSDIPPEPTPVPPAPSGGGGVNGGAVAGAIAGGTAVAAAGAGAGAASFFSGLAPGIILGLAAPIYPMPYSQAYIDSIMCNPVVNQYLIKAVNHIFDYLRRPDTLSIYVSDGTIAPNSYNVTYINILNTKTTFNVRILQASSAVNQEEEAVSPDFRIFKNIGKKDIDKIFRTKRFKRPFIKDKELTFMPKETLYKDGLITKGAVINPVTVKQIAIVTINTTPKGTPPIRYAYVITFN